MADLLTSVDQRTFIKEATMSLDTRTKKLHKEFHSEIETTRLVFETQLKVVEAWAACMAV
jgi:hypothetical protein